MKPALIESLSGSLDKKVSNIVEALSRVQLMLEFISPDNIAFAFAAAHKTRVVRSVIFPFAPSNLRLHMLRQIKTSQWVTEVRP